MGHPRHTATFSGIDPDKLPGTINSLESDRKRLYDSAARFRTRFTRYSLDTGPLDRLLAISHWAGDQVPLLRRRQHLAAAIGEHGSGRTLISVPDSAVTPGAAARAAAQGRALATRFARQMADHDGAVPEDLFAALAAGGNDGDLLHGFFAALGPRRLSQLSNSMSGNPYDRRYADHPDQLAYDRDVLARSFGGFTRVAADTRPLPAQRSFWASWFDGFDDPGQGFRPDLLLPLVDSGTYDTDFLVALADRVFTTDPARSVTPRMSGSPTADPWQADHYVQLFDALAKCPLAAGRFVSLRPDITSNALYPGGGNTTPDRVGAFARALKAATITLRATDPALSDRNTAWLLTTNLAHTRDPALQSTHPYPAISLLFSEVMAQHWDDLQYALTSPAQDAFWPAPTWNPTAFTRSQNPTRDGLELHPSVWKAFMEEAIREPHAAASMSALFETYGNKLAALTSSIGRSSDASVDFISFKMGLSDNFYSDAFTQTELHLGNEAQAWADDMTKVRKDLVLTAVGVAAGGEEGAAEIAKEQGQGYAHSLLEAWVGEQVQVPPEKAPSDLIEGIKGLKNTRLKSTWKSAFAIRAGALIATHFSTIKKVTFVAPGGADNPPFYSGNPYAPHVPADGPRYIAGPEDDFVAAIKSNHGQVDVAKMTPRQQGAYAAWLEDPAVAAKLGDDGVYFQIMGQ
ncbi:hypothetical protein SAMN05216223_13031 [Actinacidiphila yanglinensis]|uniref:Uncharacterized protein n=1 Tax=Actinacidiphila yanglinensis TaxID=310779 RepID=A0A1H6E9C2_9ACTN|nr:hypothetical protein [Actinacidiphila yanglinensis]SEG94418.1 hypothetical protein SAMN05216223_13031 [Actinacidiphila yanglinensis]